jgi:hypothetical protein
MKMCFPLGRLARLVAVAVFVLIVSTDSRAFTHLPQGWTSTFAVLAGTAVTCTKSTISGDVGVSPGSAVTRTGCHIDGKVHAADAVAEQAYLDFVNAYNDLRDDPPPCDDTLIGTLAGLTLGPGVYCVDSVAKTGRLILDAQGDANAEWTFLVDGALTGTNFSVVMVNGGEPCNVLWWVEAAATLTTSDFVGTIFAGEAITITGGTFSGDALAKAAVTLTGTAVTACAVSARPGSPGAKAGKCNQGVGNGAEGCDPGNSNHHNPTNDESGGTPGAPGRKKPPTQ